MESAPLPAHDRWLRLKVLLAHMSRDGDVEQAEAVLDLMEGLAVKGGNCRPEFLALLEDKRFYSPAWSSENAAHCRIKWYEFEGRLPEAINRLRSQFFPLLKEATEPDSWSASEARTILDRMAELGGDAADIQQLRELLPSHAVVARDGLDLGRPGTAAHVVYKDEAWVFQPRLAVLDAAVPPAPIFVQRLDWRRDLTRLDPLNRNMELGLWVQDHALVVSIAGHFLELIRRRVLVELKTEGA